MGMQGISLQAAWYFKIYLQHYHLERIGIVCVEKTVNATVQFSATRLWCNNKQQRK